MSDPPRGAPHGEAGQLPVTVAEDRIHVGEGFSLALQRTLRVPDDGRAYPLPPGLGPLPVLPVAELAGRVPPDWTDRGGFVVPVYQREAVWLHFTVPPWRPKAVRVGVGRIDAVTGGPWEEDLRADPQNYVICPDQPWLDGIKTGDGTVRQFVAVALGAGDTVEEQLTGTTFGGLQLRVFESRPGRFPDRPPAGAYVGLESPITEDVASAGEFGMGIAAGGAMRQRIYPDRYGLDAWDPRTYGTAYIHLVNSRQYRAATGSDPPPSPVTAATYTQHGLPWFTLYDEERGDLAASERLRSVESLRERDARRGVPPDETDRPLHIDPDQVVELPNPPDEGHRDRGDG